MRINEVDKPVTQTDIDQLEVFADRLFAKVGIDVEFTRHFLDRVNDERNIKQITMSELTRLFKQEYKRWGKPIAQLGPDAEAVMKDMVTDINLPFALRWDHQNKELDLVAKTVMRKADFKTSNQEFAVEDVGGKYSSWDHEEPADYSLQLEKTFGEPDEMTDEQTVWQNIDGFKRVVCRDEYILHGSPAPHYDFIYCYVDLEVPESLSDELAKCSGSILIDHLKNEVGARCGSLTANATTLNFVMDVVAGRVKPVKEEYEARILGMKKKFEDGEHYKLDWWPDESGDADPENPYYAEGIEEDVKQSGVMKVINNIAMRRDNDPFPIKFDSGKLIYVKPLTARKILHVFDIAPQEAIDKFMTYIKTPNGFKELAQLANNRIKTSVVREAPNEGLKSLFKPNAYAVAAKKLHSVLQRKKQENDVEGKPFRHALGWYASNIAGSYRTHINTKELISYYQDNYDAVLSESDLPYITEEAALKLDYDQLKIKIPANDNAKPKTGQVIDLNARRAAAKEALSKMSDVEKKAANEFIKKNKTLLQRLSAVGARSAARHGIATVSSAVTGPAAPVVATVLNVTLLGWDLVDAGVEVWKWARSSDSKDIEQGNANREFSNEFALEIPEYPTTWPMDRTGTVLKRKQSEWMEEFGNTHLRNGDLNPSAGYQDAILRIAQANIDAKNKASDNELIKKEPEKELEKAPVINFTEIPPLEVPEFKPGKIKIPRPAKDREIDIEIPKFPNAPSKDKPFKKPETPKDPIIDPRYTPTQPKNPKDNPEVPDSKPSDQPEEVPQPLKAPQKIKTLPKLPPLEVPSQEIAFQKDAPPVVTTVGGATPPGSGSSKNNKKRKKKKDYGGGDVDYNDPLQRWQKKYGTWEPRSR